MTKKQNSYAVTLPRDEQVFADGKVTCIGQIVGAIVAKDQVTAQRAAKLVKIQYEDISPVIITIEDAIKQKSFYGEKNTFKCGDIEKGFKQADQIIEGEMHVGGQEHFYLETQAALAVPKNENGEMEVFSSTQNHADIQHWVAESLDVPHNHIVVRTKRLGGGFGGKESKSGVVAIPCAIAANK